MNDIFFYFAKNLKIIFDTKKMHKPLSLVEKPQPEVSIDDEKLRFFISKIPIWDHFSLTEHAYRSSSVGEKTTLLNRYYRELYQKYYGLGNLFLFILTVCLLGFFRFLSVSYNFS